MSGHGEHEKIWRVETVAGQLLFHLVGNETETLQRQAETLSGLRREVLVLTDTGQVKKCCAGCK